MNPEELLRQARSDLRHKILTQLETTTKAVRSMPENPQSNVLAILTEWSITNISHILVPSLKD